MFKSVDVWWFGGFPFWSFSFLFLSLIIVVLLLRDVQLNKFSSIYVKCSLYVILSFKEKQGNQPEQS